MIKQYKLFTNSDAKAQCVSQVVRNAMNQEGFIEDEQNFDLGIAVGGDGSFLRMVKACKFDTNIHYVGVNAGTLGFLQEIKPSQVANFVKRLKSGRFRVEELGVQHTIVSGDRTAEFKSFNEIVVREKDLNTLYLEIFIDGILLEKLAGDGVLVATSSGSTAYNLSFGGCVVYNSLNTLQLTPIAPLNNKVYRSMRNSVVIPQNRTIELLPLDRSKDIIMSVDGENVVFDNVKSITTKIADEKIKVLRMSRYDYTKVINNKFLKY